MLKDRLRTSAILIAIIAALLYLDGHHSKPGAEGIWLLPLLLCLWLSLLLGRRLLGRGAGSEPAPAAGLSQD